MLVHEYCHLFGVLLLGGEGIIEMDWIMWGPVLMCKFTIPNMTMLQYIFVMFAGPGFAGIIFLIWGTVVKGLRFVGLMQLAYIPVEVTTALYIRILLPFEYVVMGIMVFYVIYGMGIMILLKYTDF